MSSIEISSPEAQFDPLAKYESAKSAFMSVNAVDSPLSNASVPNSNASLDPSESTLLGQPARSINGSSCPVTSSCPVGMSIYAKAQEEFSQIREAHVLAPTGCSADFCQAGRHTRLNEPRVGRDRPIEEIQKEAVGFLRECRRCRVISTDEQLNQRILEATSEICSTAVLTTITDKDGKTSMGIAGGVWQQTPAELEYGIRAAWRNARRCIMRSQHESLVMCDMRHIKTSKEMAEHLVDGMLKAFNGGQIKPTAFMFPPRSPKSRGPMIWNHQILAFAGYQQEDGTVLGDPINVELTESIVELGWQPPSQKTRWDILPIVTMAENDDPYLLELPSELKRTIHIVHPYNKGMTELDLRWVIAPALSRLGFDLGGNQYTATPFIGWFMDAEIGVRDLTDTFRYNVLPDVVKALNLSDQPDTPLEDLPEYLKLATLSRAQAELNLAVFHSFRQNKVMMSDSLSSSAEYMKFDTDRKAELGYRLPADPYWLAPPQGSIIPIWHQGGAPNYQPKPMICRHVQDPIKAWRREHPEYSKSAVMKADITTTSKILAIPTIRIFTCSAGVSAGKLARRLFDNLRKSFNDSNDAYHVAPELPLNRLDLHTIDSDDILLIIASTTGQGDIPKNAERFITQHETLARQTSLPRFACFGNGDSTYQDSYNAAAQKIQDLLVKVGCRPMLDTCFPGDTAIHNPDWTSFGRWTDIITTLILQVSKGEALDTSMLMKAQVSESEQVHVSRATLVSIQQSGPEGIIHVVLDIGDRSYQEMDHIKITSPNLDCEVANVLDLLSLPALQSLGICSTQNAETYLRIHVDLSHPFKTLDWYPNFANLSAAEQAHLRASNAIAVLEGIAPSACFDFDTKEIILRDMATIRPRVYSVASSLGSTGSGHLDILVKPVPGGRFSSSFLKQATPGLEISYSLSSPDIWSIINSNPCRPIIAFATGSGIGPIWALLQRRVADALPDARGALHLFAGYKTVDSDLIEEIVRPAQEAGLFGILELVESNERKLRAQDRVREPEIGSVIVQTLQDPECVVFVCANELAALGMAQNLSTLVGQDVKQMLGDRFIEEVFRG